jgi:hypothetical protein
MYFPPNQKLSITDLTRRFRVVDTDIETWSKEGFFPHPDWAKGRKHWDSNEINRLIKGCQIPNGTSQLLTSRPPSVLFTIFAIALFLLISH